MTKAAAFHVNQCTCMLGAGLDLCPCIRNKLQTHDDQGKQRGCKVQLGS